MSRLATLIAVMDEIDRAILGELKRDARISFRDLGEAVGLSANAAAERLRRLVASRAIRRFSTEVDARAVGLNLAAFVDLRLDSGISADAFEQRLRTLPGVVSSSLTTGHFDYTLRVAVGSEPDLVALIESLRASGAAETHSRIILREMSLS
jgi:Lrp/AsnC family leucine-responsive transcriptional regulator